MADVKPAPEASPAAVSSLKPPIASSSPKLLRIRLALVEVFRREDVLLLVSRLEVTLGPSERFSGSWGPNSLTTHTWKVAELKNLFYQITNPDSHPLSKISADELNAAITAVSASIGDSEGLPFAVLSFNVTLNPRNWDGIRPEELGRHLIPISHALRGFVQSLGGMIAASTSWSPNTPCVTWAGISVTPQELVKIGQVVRSEVGNPLVWERRDPNFVSWIPQNPPEGFPFRLEADYRNVQARSFLEYASNVVFLLGVSHGFGGLVDPYCICVASDPGLITTFPDEVINHRFLTLPGPEPDFMWGPGSLASVVALNGWLRAIGIDVGRVEASASKWRFSSGSLGSPRPEVDLNAILEIGVRTARLASDLGVISRLSTEPLANWESGVFVRSHEVPDSAQGLLGRLGHETLLALANQSARLSGISEEVGLLAQYASDRTSAATNKTIRDLTGEIATYSRRSAWLTGALVVLTVVVMALTTVLILK